MSNKSGSFSNSMFFRVEAATLPKCLVTIFTALKIEKLDLNVDRNRQSVNDFRLYLSLLE